MLYSAGVLFIMALIAATLGFGIIVVGTDALAKMLFAMFLVTALLLLFGALSFLFAAVLSHFAARRQVPHALSSGRKSYVRSSP
jgi:uncharacterized membrane protein YtjA (UPF0391 family)